ncbi:MAG: hypothetical protein IT324_27945 [Anaerolineae bacterium]|nr:hypothetical protein [Anaerolineae bacterium]
MVKRRFVRFVVLALFISFTMATAVSIRPAHALSSGCAFLDQADGPESPGAGPGRFDVFNAGEVLTVITTLVDPGPSQFQIEDPVGTVVAGPIDVPGRLSYTIPTTGIHNIGIRNLLSSAGDIMFQLSCGLPAPDPVGQPPKFFDPGDARIEGWAHERLAVYCNQPGKVVIYGIDPNKPDNRKGFLLTVFSFNALVDAGTTGLITDLGENGRVTASLTKGWLWIAWNGGKFNATGSGAFVKNFDTSKCNYGGSGGRVDNRPQDRLAVYCNQPDRVVIYGIDPAQTDNNKGFPLVEFSFKALLDAGAPGVTKSAGVNGTVTASVINGWFWIAWNGGRFNATGQGAFAKNFETTKCNFGQ